MGAYSVAAAVLGAAVLLGRGAEARLAPDISAFGEMAFGDFKPLTCNAAFNGVDPAGWTCSPWTAANEDLALPVTIPCGTCYDLADAEGSELYFLGGLDIQGALRIPNNWKGTIRTPYVFVQGHLVVTNDAEVNGDSIDGLTFVLEGVADQPFFPHNENTDACRGTSCEVGKKPFIVAGGQIHVNALSDTCPTWVPLLDVIRNDDAVAANDYPTPPTPPDGCTNDIINHDFETGYGPFYWSQGSEEALVQGGSHDGSTSFKVQYREKTWQGPFVELNPIRGCLVSNQTYLVDAKAKIYLEDDSGNSTNTNCHINGTDCLQLTLHTSNDKNESRPDLAWRTLGLIEPSQKTTDGEWFDFTAEFELTDEDLSSDSLYQMMYFGGPETGVAIEIDDVRMRLPTPDLFPDPSKGSVCNDLVINGDAENFPPHKFPWGYMGNLGSSVTVKKEVVNGTENHYFAVRGRNATWASISVELINDCIVRHAQYTISAKIRLNSVNETDVRMILKTWPLEPPAVPPEYKTESVGFGGISSCVGLNADKGWFECSRQFQFKEIHETATKIELSFVIPEDMMSDVDFDDIRVVRYAPPLDMFVVDSSIVGCWGPNATILQTSHTLSDEDENVLTIESVTDSGNGTAIIKTTTPVAKPSTAADDPNFAVEIALLDRNVKIMPIDPSDDFNPLHGGHFMIAHTPNISQTFKGVHMSKMGQQGNFGRYPIHLHMNENVTGTEISRNLVSGSNQRCIVVHGTHNVLLEHNIAHDTFGHCFMLEDGIEQNNTFNYNLGSKTKETPDEGILSIAESDMFCATFWISNPRNYFKGNVAAGSEDTGFWYEFLELVRGPSVKLDPYYEVNPSSFLFGHFKENIFHSNKGEGFKLYPNGYFPDERAVFEDSRSIKNKGDGILLHNSRNLGIDGGFYADNRMQIEVDKQADDVTVTNAFVVGFSDLYKFESEAGGVASHCPAHRPISGVQLHSFLRFRDSKGYHLENITFTSFEEGGMCIGTTAIEMDKQLRDGHFDAFATLKNLQFDEGAPMKEKFNMCALSWEEMFLGDLAINDLDGSLHPEEAGVPGFIVSNTTMMTDFVAEGSCKDMEGSCALFCENVCYRTLNFAVPVAFAYEDMVMEVTETSTGKTSEFPGYFENMTKVVRNVDVEDVYENFVYQRRRYYSPIVPAGNYTFKFKKNGADFWPMMAEVMWEDPPVCEPYIDDNTTQFIIPTPTPAECANLVRNPGAEDGSYNYWMHSGGGIRLFDGGATGSYAIASEERTGAWQGPGQFLDIRCLKDKVGQQFEITAKFKLVDGGGNEADCDPNQKNINAFDVCPRVSFRMRQMLGNKIGDGVEVNYAYPMAEAVSPFTTGEWNNIYGVFTVTQTMADADAIFMFVERARAGVDIVVDDMLIQPVTVGCNDIIYNGDFESGDTRFWQNIGESKTDIYEPGHAGSAFALQTTERLQFWSSMSHEINLDCLVEGESYGITAMILLLDDNGNPTVNCNPQLNWGTDGTNNICPSLAMRVVTGNLTVDEYIGGQTGGWTDNTWNQFNGLLTATPEIKKADSVTLYFTRYREGLNLAIDDVTMTPITAQDPNQLVNNGDGSAGDARYFDIHDCGSIGATSPGFDDDTAFIVSGRTEPACGISQAIDNTYLEAGIMYKIGAKVKLTLADGTTPFDCDPGVNSGDAKCPLVTLRSQNPSEPQSQRPVAAVKGDWARGDWNTMEGYVTFFPSEISSAHLTYYIDGPKADVVMILDNIELSRTGFNPGNATATA